MDFMFWGTRGSIPTPGPTTVKYGGNTSCVEINAGGKLLVMDAGTGIRLLGLDLFKRPVHPKIIDIFITHTHWDHIQGFPFFPQSFIPEYTIRVYGRPGTGHDTAEVMEWQMGDDFFPLSFKELSAGISFCDLDDEPVLIGDVTVRTTFLNHPGLALGFSVEHEGKKLAYCPDVEPFRLNVLSEDTAVNVCIEDYVNDLDSKTVEFVRGADVLIIDGTYTVDEYQAKLGWGHSSYEDSIRLANKAGVKELFLIHHDPMHTDDFIDDMVRKAHAFIEAKGYPVRCRFAVEGERHEI